MDDGVREVHGVARADGDITLTLHEQGNAIVVSLGYRDCRLSVGSAKHIRRNLSRLIRRIEEREIAP